MTQKGKILICPLDWGLGHATRMVPVINMLIEKQFDVKIASSGNALKFLEKEFPDIEQINFPNYKIQYSRSGSQVIKMFLLFPRILFWSVKEHFKIKKIIKDNHIDILISDNRFGLWNNSTYNIFITHQLKLSFPNRLKFIEPIYLYAMKWIINRYNECWIPDLEGEKNLAGNLSHTSLSSKKIFYIGPLSRYSTQDIKETKEKEFDALFILSGPEPQRSIFEDIIFFEASHSKLNLVLVRGTDSKTNKDFQFPVFDILNSQDLKALIEKSDLVICRSGYSSVMDLMVLGKKAVLVPTPGQTEQEYLATYLMEKGLFFSINQKSFNLEQAQKNSFKNPAEISFSKEREMLKTRIELLKERDNH